MTFLLGAYFELVFDQFSLEDFGGRQLFDGASHGACEVGIGDYREGLDVVRE